MQSSLRPSSVCSTKLGEHGIRAGDIMGTTSSKSQAPSIHNLLSCRLRRKAMCLLTPGKRSSGFSIPHIQHTSDSSFSARQWIDCLNGPPRQDHPNLQQAVSHGPSEWQEEGALLATPCSVSYWTMGCYRVAGRKKEHRGIVGCNCVGNFKTCLYLWCFNLNPCKAESKLGVQGKSGFPSVWKYNIVVQSVASNKH